jgi:hypothetical protein
MDTVVSTYFPVLVFLGIATRHGNRYGIFADGCNAREGGYGKAIAL